MVRTIVAVSVISLLACAGVRAVQAGRGVPDVIPADAGQMIVGLADGWQSTTVRLQTYERRDVASPWVQIGSAWTANVGRNGLAVGRGLWPRDGILSGVLRVSGEPRQKREGDGCAPAGIFEIVPRPYGYDVGRGLPNGGQELTTDDYCVDDAVSSRYNSLVRSKTAEHPWRSAEVMRRDDALYSRLAVIGHNGIEQGLGAYLQYAPTQRGAGSCIFFHVERGPGVPTSGCTSMPEADMDRLLSRLDPARPTVYVLLPRAVYEQLRRNSRGLPPTF